MLVEILYHNVDTYVAEIKFTHNDVVVQDTYNLLLVEPSMKRALETLNMTFTPEMQQTVIEKLTAWVERSIDRGGLQNIDV